MRAVVVLGLWLGVAAVVAACPVPCGPSSCAGCCSPEGECAPGVSTSACGSGGGQCLSCSSGDRCRVDGCVTPDGGADAGPPCGCARGCCLEDGGCMPGNEPTACGLTDRACSACGSGERCDRGFCTVAPCTGCLDPAGACQPGTVATACGLGGGVCVGCLTGERCESGACVARPCNSTTCATGCCALDARCIASPTNAQCGALGSDCQACSGGTTCTQGACQ